MVLLLFRNSDDVIIYMKFHEDILDCFKVIDWTKFCYANYYLRSEQGFMVLVLQTLSNVG